MNAKISARILAAMDTGLSLPEAVDAVLGAGTYDAIVTDTYNALKGAA